VNNLLFRGLICRTLYSLPVTFYQLPPTLYLLPTFPLDNQRSKNSLRGKFRAKNSGLAAVYLGRGLTFQSPLMSIAGVGARPLPGPTLAFQFTQRFQCITVHLSEFEPDEKWRNMANLTPVQPATKCDKCMHTCACIDMCLIPYTIVTYEDKRRRK